ncbi:MAG: DUF262 domain-containing protein [Alloprevotella sp.]|nr:DUF262 domain-containing protein [Alloprevotella sp.]
MDIKLRKVTVRELTQGYEDNEEGGIRGYNGKLDIRPPYQREFIYDDKKRAAVITTVKNGYPLNVMYWATRDNDADCPYEVMDGQQRTISLCQYVNGEFAYDFKFFNNLTTAEQDEILNYELTVYVCSGTDKERLEWFQTINIAGEKLEDQELRNAVYAGPFVSDAKRYFSRANCPAYQMGKDLLDGSPIRQKFLETAIKWICIAQSTPAHRITIEGYMALHQHDPNALQLWQHFVAIITWITGTFDVRKRARILKGLDWGTLYHCHHKRLLNKSELDKQIASLLLDTEIQRPKGIVPYILTGDERELDLRIFPEIMRQASYERQKGICPICGLHFDIEDMEADHITPWSEGGKTEEKNCQMLCRDCNRRKSNK